MRCATAVQLHGALSMSLVLPLLALLPLRAAHAAAPLQPSLAEHTKTRDAIVAAMNGKLSEAVPQFLALLDEHDDDARWCDPFPSCHYGMKNISVFLRSLPPSTDVALLAEPMVTVGTVGGMMTTLSFSFPGSDASCLYTADQHVSWNISRSTSTDRPKVNYVHWVYNASEFEAATRGCRGPAAAQALREQWFHGHTKERSNDLQVVKDYVVSLQYSVSSQALVCDLLLPASRYCDPFPRSCAIGRSGCREMKGLPPGDNSSSNLMINAAAAASEQCRPGSVRPLMATGPATGAMYLAYSSASRAAALLGQMKHRLHHTFAIWQLAPPNNATGSHRHRGAGGELVPMLASFDWFMPNHNV